MTRRVFLLALMSACTIATPSAQRLTPLAQRPDWNRLDDFQETITREEFVALLNGVYAPDGAAGGWIAIESDGAMIRTGSGGSFKLRFAPDPSVRRPIPRYWHTIPRGAGADRRPLKGFTIALDPGHLGGKWARIEERWFQIPNFPPVMEGTMTLRVAQLLAPRLEALGANVEFVRSKLGPITRLRPGRLKDEARQSLVDRGVRQILPTYSGPNDPNKADSIPWEAERLFYRVGEIHDRAEIVNRRLKPDLVICLHFDAEPWGDPARPALTDVNHLHLLINGSYGPTELTYDDVRFAMLLKLLNRSFADESALSETVAMAMRQATGLPAYHYTGTNARSVGKSGYVWTRNLLANRLYECPVLYLEPYVMNSREVFARVQAGEYPGTRAFGGVARLNIYEEYVQGVVNGIVAYVRGGTMSGEQ
jgi:N-acetylmuramoyl-L-alanine amidase